MARKIQTASRSERLEARVTPAEKALFLRAAELAGRSLTDFVVANLHRAVQEMQREQSVMLLSAVDSKHFAAALIDPAAPNDALVRAAKSFRARGERLDPA